MKAASEEKWHQNWYLRSGDQIMLDMPRLAVIRSTLINHAIQHRGQLLVYLRLKDVPVPGFHSPSADES